MLWIYVCCKCLVQNDLAGPVSKALDSPQTAGILVRHGAVSGGRLANRDSYRQEEQRSCSYEPKGTFQYVLEPCSLQLARYCLKGAQVNPFFGTGSEMVPENGIMRSGPKGEGRTKSHPEAAVQGAVLDGLCDVLDRDGWGGFEVGDSAGDLEDAVVGAGAEALLLHGALEEAFRVGG